MGQHFVNVQIQMLKPLFQLLMYVEGDARMSGYMQLSMFVYMRACSQAERLRIHRYA